METQAILAIDQGTTSSRAMVFSLGGDIVAQAQREFPQHYPQGGWVEHDPEDIWQTTLTVAKEALARAEQAGVAPAAIGITNQRETTVVWERASGRAIYPAIVWQDRRTAERCAALGAQGLAETVQARSGLLLDPYFSATKLAWILDRVPGARARAERGELAFGTVDSFLIWRLTGGRVHATDASNASRTSLFNIHTQQWDDELLRIFQIPAALLPEVRDCADDYGRSDPGILGREMPILGVAGDQQAAAIGQCCFAEGSIKSTYGTGCFVMINSGARAIRSTNRLLTTVAYRLRGRTTYALEGSIFIAGAAIQWLRDGLGLIRSAAESEALASGLSDNGGVYLVPAFTGLGAPWWQPDARGALYGLKRDTGPAHLARAALEAAAYQSADLLRAVADDGIRASSLRVDGGMIANNWLLQFLADVLNLPVERPRVLETTALGAAYLAALQAGFFNDLNDISGQWQLDARATPAMADDQRRRLLGAWDSAVRATIGIAQP